MALFDTKYPNTSRVVTGTPQLFNDDVILLCDTSAGPVTINLLEIPDGNWNVNWKLYVIDNNNNASVNNIIINAGAGQTINTQVSETITTNSSGALIRIASNNQYLASQLYIPPGGGGVQSVTGLNTDNTDPLNPIVKISVDGVTITGQGTPADPLIATAGSAYNTIEDDGVVFPQRNILNFIGPGFTVIDVAPKTNVAFTPPVIDITNANLLTAIAGSTLLKGAHYRVTDPTFAEDVQIRALETDSVGMWGEGTFLYADYQSAGDYSGVAGFVSQLGVWYKALTPANGDVCIYNNNHYVNITGANGLTPPNVDVVNWTQLAKSNTTGFIEAQESVIYNVNTNISEHRWDKYKNYFMYGNPKGIVNYDNIPFGNAGMVQNQFINNVSITNLMNQGQLTFRWNILEGALSFGYVYTNSGTFGFDGNHVSPTGTFNVSGEGQSSVQIAANQIYGGLEISGVATGGNLVLAQNQINTGSGIVINGKTGPNKLEVRENELTCGGKIQIGTLDTTASDVVVQFNSINQFGSMIINVLNAPAQLERNRMSYDGLFIIPLMSDNAIHGGVECVLDSNTKYSNWPKELDMNVNYNPGTGTLNLGSETWVGRYLVKNGTGQTISLVSGGGSLVEFEIVCSGPVVGLNYRLSAFAYAGSVNNQVVTNGSLTYNSNQNFNPDYTDAVKVQKSSVGGQLFVLSQKVYT